MDTPHTEPARCDRRVHDKNDTQPISYLEKSSKIPDKNLTVQIKRRCRMGSKYLYREMYLASVGSIVTGSVEGRVCLLNPLRPELFFLPFLLPSLREALVVYQLIDAALIGNFLVILSLKDIEILVVKACKRRGPYGPSVR